MSVSQILYGKTVFERFLYVYIRFWYKDASPMKIPE